MGNTVFFRAKKLMERWYLLITESYYFELFGDGKHGLFFSEKVDEKMMLTWSFQAFHDIPGLWKYGFLCSEHIKHSHVFNKVRTEYIRLIRLKK